MKDELLIVLEHHANESPDMPAYLALGVKQYDELCKRIVCHYVTPLKIAAERLRELQEVNRAD